MSRLTVRVYRALLLLLPRSFRREHGDEIVALFERTVREARGRGRWAQWRAVWTGWVGALSAAVGEWGDESSRVPVVGPRTTEGGTMGTGMAIRQAFRSVRRGLGLSTAVVALLGLGIGATITVLSVVDGVLVRNLPYPDPDRLVVVQDAAHSWPDFEDWRETVPAFAELAAVSGQTLTLTGDVPVNVEGARISDGFFDLVGATAGRGRLPSMEEYREGRRVTALGYDAWLRRWGGDPSIVGSTIPVDGEPYEVVGVVARDFVAPSALTGQLVELWIPVDPNGPGLTRHTRSFDVLGRLADGASVADATDQLHERAVAFAHDFPDTYAEDDGTPRRLFPAQTLAEATTEDARGPLLILLSGAFLLLLVACGNAASLLLVRGAAREGELATRRALGGARRVILLQLLAESAILALVGAAIGLGLAQVGVGAVRALEPGELPRLGEVSVDLRIAATAIGIAVLAGLGAGLVPAFFGVRASPAEILTRVQGGTRGRTNGAGRRSLVVAEAALASLLLVGSLAVVRGFGGLMAMNPGFEPDGAYAVSIDVGRDVPEEERGEAAERIRETLAAWPGVQAAGAGIAVPYQMSGGRRCCWLGELTYRDVTIDRAWVHPVTAGYFESLGIAFRSGRGFEPRDRSEGTVPVVLNDAAARELFGDETGLDQTIEFASTEMRVVGIIEDVRHWGADQPIEEEFYLPYEPMGAWASGLTFAFRTETSPTLDEIRAKVAEVAPRAVVDDLRPMSAVLGDSMARFRFYTLVLSVFALCSLVLACAGLAGTLLYDVRLRRHELGVRMAMGAPTGDLVLRVVRRAVATVAFGAVLGFLGCWPLRRQLEALVPGAELVDPLSLGALVVLLALTAAIAAWAPARLVARTDPVRSLS